MAIKNIELKFNVSDNAYCIRRKSVEGASVKVCPVCNGSGTFVSPTGTLRNCPGVSGYSCVNGKMSMTKYVYYPKKTRINEIIITDENIFYLIDVDEIFNDCMLVADDLYTTEEEAQVECDMRNNQE